MWSMRLFDFYDDDHDVTDFALRFVALVECCCICEHNAQIGYSKDLLFIARVILLILFTAHRIVS